MAAKYIMQYIARVSGGGPKVQVGHLSSVYDHVTVTKLCLHKQRHIVQLYV